MLPRVDLIRGDEADYLLFATDDVQSQHLRVHAAWDGAVQAISQLFCTLVEQPLVIDIGANLGAYAVPLGLHLAKNGGHILAFEPQRIPYYQLCGNVVLNRLDNVTAINKAVGIRDQIIQLPEIDLWKCKNVGGFSIEDDLNQIRQMGADFTGSSHAIEMIRLDSMDVPRTPCLIKMDVEGHEEHVLRGGWKALQQWRFPPIIFEAWNLDWFATRRASLFELLREYGYDITLIHGDDYIAQHPQGSAHVEVLREGEHLSMRPHVPSSAPAAGTRT